MEAILETFTQILKEELKPAMGCTEPIAIAYCSAKAKEALAEDAEEIKVYCSGNIIKNTKAVTVPNSNGKRGIAVAAILGATGGSPEKELEVLTTVTDEDIKETERLLEKGICTVYHEKNVENLYIRIEMKGAANTASCTIKTKHTFISEIKRNGQVIFSQPDLEDEIKTDKSSLNLKNIYEYAKTVPLEDIEELLLKQVECNFKIASEGLSGNYGAQIGKTLINTYGTKDWRVLAAATAAAGSDARMGGCALPVIINSGSGNQGITVSMPVYVYARENGKSKEELVRGLALANLVSLLQKSYIGDLSAYCGVCCAGCSSVCGIAFIDGADYETIGHIIINAASTIGGMVCDGAKSSCASKISSALMTSFTAFEQAKKGLNFLPGEGMIVDDIEKTIANIGRMGRVGMKGTDEEILQIMLGY